jgi:hypothetical protein
MNPTIFETHHGFKGKQRREKEKQTYRSGNSPSNMAHRVDIHGIEHFDFEYAIEYPEKLFGSIWFSPSGPLTSNLGTLLFLPVA